MWWNLKPTVLVVLDEEKRLAKRRLIEANRARKRAESDNAIQQSQMNSGPSPPKQTSYLPPTPLSTAVSPLHRSPLISQQNVIPAQIRQSQIKPPMVTTNQPRSVLHNYPSITEYK
uniref:Uncharacterized protein n=1 Tax=Schistosoma haematobium TaxID=6185 RepID=A0A095A787_SCHHA